MAVDFKYRDLPGLILIKALLEQLGPYEVRLIPHVPSVREARHVRSFRPHLVVQPYYLSRDDFERARRYRQANVGVAVLPTEGNPLVSIARLQQAGLFTDLSPVNLFFVWNGTIEALVAQHQTTGRSRCLNIGVPRFDFYHPRFRQLLEPPTQFRRRHGIRSEGPLLTWATAFTFAAYREKSAAEKRSLASRHPSEGVSSTDLDIPSFVEWEWATRARSTEAVLDVARRMPHGNVVIKVHPAEDADWYRYRAQSSGLTNVTVIAQDYIGNVLNASDIHLARACTTTIEAWLLDKPTVELAVTPDFFAFDVDMSPGSVVARSADECVEAVSGFLAGATISREQVDARRRIITDFAGVCDGGSAERCAAAIHAYFQGPVGEPLALRLTKTETWNTVRARAMSWLGLEPHHSLRAWVRRQPQDPRGKYYSPADEAAWTEAVRLALGLGTSDAKKLPA